MRTDVLIEMVGSIFNDTLCEGCEMLKDDGEMEYSDVFGSCLGCRGAAARAIIRKLWEDLEEE